LCEHHLLPFKSEISMAYIATEHVLGLSKFARIAHKYSHRLQVQERLVHQIADEITAITDARDVAVLHAESIFACKCAESRATD